MIKTYEIRNPQFFPNVRETVTRDCKPYEIALNTVSGDELEYFELVKNTVLDRR